MFKNWYTAGALAVGLTFASTAQAEQHTILMTGFSYFPAVTFVSPGDTVVFINDSGEEQTVIAADAGWTVGPLLDQEEGSLVVETATELKFFSAYNTESCDADGTCSPSDGTYEEATIKAEISFEAPS